jgi:hypothetical protein
MSVSTKKPEAKGGAYQSWRKLGVVLTAEDGPAWMNSHAAVPCVEPVKGSIVRMYFCSRDAKNRSQAGSAMLDLSEGKVFDVDAKPLLTPGELGAFDDCGVTPTALVERNGRKYMFYVGWHSGSTVRMHLWIGLALSDDGGKTFHRANRAPLLERCAVDPFLTATLSLIEIDGTWRMWYVSGEGWTRSGEETFPRYDIKVAESKDLLNWKRKGMRAIALRNKKEFALARPSVQFHGGLYRMWFCSKSDEEDYSLGYAESFDGISWSRHDQLVRFETAEGDFDSDMRAYPCVFENGGRLYMLYNGNGYGKTGIGLAVLA